MLSVEQVRVEFGSFVLFDEVSFMVNPRDRIGLTGKNGAGKTTLLRILNGEISPSAGQVSKPSDLTIGYLPQQMNYSDTQTVQEEARAAFGEVVRVQNKIEQINRALAERTDYQSAAYLQLITRLSEATERLEVLGGGNIDAALEQTLTGLGFSRHDLGRPTAEFSGGWRMRIELAKILLKQPDLMLLDEPTNHLDIESIQWLEEFLRDYPGALLLISHDRKFLDTVTNRTIEITLGKIYDYNLSYSEFVEQRRQQREQQLAAYKNQQKEIQETERFIERFRYKASKAVQVQSRIKQLEKIERIEVEEEEKAALTIKFPPAPRSGAIVVETKRMSKAYGENLVLNDIDLIIERGEKVAFVGKNGEGKSTLVKVILNQVGFQGECKLGHNVSIGYFAQNQAQLLDDKKTVFETIDDVAVGDIRPKIRDILGAFLFSGETIDKKVSVLSGGERSRLALAQLLLQPYSLLVLDEPTNHLDMRSKDILKQALSQYDGTLIVVSHDRDFLDGLVKTVYEFKNKKIKQHLGGIYDFLNKRKLDSLREIERRQKEQKKNAANSGTSANKQQYLQRKEMDKKIRQAENKVEKSETEIARREKKIAEMDEKMSNPQAHDLDQAFYAEYKEHQQALKKEMENWEQFSLELEELQEEREI